MRWSRSRRDRRGRSRGWGWDRRRGGCPGGGGRSKKSKKSKKDKAAPAARSEREERERFFELSFGVIKRSLRNFSAESDVTKLQILNTACKLYVKDPARAGPALKHVLDLCAADPSVDIRDRVRVYRAMFAVGGNATPLAVFKERVVLCEKSAPQLPSPAAPTCAHALGSLSHTVEHLAPGYVPLPHPTTQPPTHVRDQYFAGNQDSSKAGRSGGAFYSDDSDDSDSDSDGSSYESSDYTSDDDSMSDSDSIGLRLGLRLER